MLMESCNYSAMQFIARGFRNGPSARHDDQGRKQSGPNRPSALVPEDDLQLKVGTLLNLFGWHTIADTLPQKEA